MALFIRLRLALLTRLIIGLSHPTLTSCLFGMVDTMEYGKYSEIVNPYEIYVLEEMESEKDRVFVLSAFPEFLVDYYGVKLWKTCAKQKRNLREIQGC